MKVQSLDKFKIPLQTSVLQLGKIIASSSMGKVWHAQCARLFKGLDYNTDTGIVLYPSRVSSFKG